MKIAFVSCFDALKDQEQTVWNRIQALQPDMLLLLGDTIYMDYFPKLGAPRKWDDDKFLDEMYRRYEAQWNVDSFRALVHTVPVVATTWDDHDFAWNNAGGAARGKKEVTREKRLISKGLHLQFRDQIRERPTPAAYPAKPDMETLLAGNDDGIEESFDKDHVRIVMLDGRTFREKPDDERESSLLGAEQQGWLAGLVNSWDGLSIVCSGSTLTRSKESWDNFNDFEWLADQNFEDVMVLSGDVHENVFRRHRNMGGLVEATSSGAALPGFTGDIGNFGLLDVQVGKVAITLYDEDGPEIEKTLDM